MYYCTECNSKFNNIKQIYEKHNLSTPPYEKVLCCPFCGGKEIKEMVYTHCKCCGARMKNTNREYCSDICEKKGKKIWEKQNQKINKEKSNPINKVLRELNEYNKKSKSKLSYGQYVAFIKYSKRKKK